MEPGKHMEPLAIVGFDIEFPQGVVSEDDFWEKVVRRECCMEALPEDRLNSSGFYHSDVKQRDTISTPGASFLRGDISAFDAPFFSISPAEAAGMDPQQRRMLETTYHAFENAGISLEEVSGTKTSVHVGAFMNDYKDLHSVDPELGSHYAATGLEASILANRLSCYFNLKGPSLTVDTACSSSLVALNLACQALRNYESDMSIIGGCNLIYSPTAFIKLSNMNFLSPDGRCYSFDSRANGYARGEGLGVIIVKHLSDAIDHGDVIRAIVRSSGVNQDGPGNNICYCP